MLNIFSNLANAITGKTTDEVIDPEVQAAEAKAARIDFHRTSVRNGPVTFRQITTGQSRRAAARAQARQIQRNFKREVRSYFERARVIAAVRGHLQIAGVIPFFDGHEAPLHDQIVSTGWLLQRFGVEVESTGRISFREGDVISGLNAALHFFNQGTGAGYKMPEGFVPAFALAEDDEMASA